MLNVLSLHPRISNYTIEQYKPYFIEHLSDDGDKNVLHHPRQKEDHWDKVEGGLPWVKRVSCPVHDVDPALLGGGLVHSEHTGGELPKPGEANVKPGI